MVQASIVIANITTHPSPSSLSIFNFIRKKNTHRKYLFLLNNKNWDNINISLLQLVLYYTSGTLLTVVDASEKPFISKEIESRQS